MTLASLALRNLSAHRGRTLATLAGVTLAIASFVILVGLARGVASTMISALEVRGTDVVVTEAGALDFMSSIIPESAAREIAEVPGVGAVSPEFSRMTNLGNGGTGFVVAWPIGAYPWANLNVQAGRLPNADDFEVAVIGQGLAARQGLSIGDNIELFHTNFRIIGTIDSSSALTRNLVFVPLPDAQRLTFREGRATSLNVQLQDDLSAGERLSLVEGMRRDWPDLSIETNESLVEGYSFTRIANVLSVSISAVAFATAILVVFNTVAMSVNERRGEIAIMSAVGWPRRRIVGCILIEGSLLALGAGIIGSFLGVVGAHLVVRIPSIAGYVAPSIDLPLLVAAVVMTCAIGIAGSLVPALQATARSPAEILRGR